MPSFERLRLLTGDEGMNKLANAFVMVYGIGGVGSYAAEALARSNIGHIALIDSDLIEESNINRQIFATIKTVGSPKVEIAEKRLHDINPTLKIDIYFQRATKDNIANFLALNPMWVIDAIDDVETKASLLENCRKKQINVISSMGFANKFHPEMIEIATLSETSVCPLARTMRQRLAKFGVCDQIPVVYSREKPTVTTNAKPLGSTAFVPAAAGLIIASYVVNKIIGEDGLKS